MLLIRNVFHCKPGQAKALIKMLKGTFGQSGPMANARVMTDVAAGFWTVVLETETESLEAWEKEFAAASSPDVRKPMEGYMELVTGGYREIFRIE